MTARWASEEFEVSRPETGPAPNAIAETGMPVDPSGRNCIEKFPLVAQTIDIGSRGKQNDHHSCGVNHAGPETDPSIVATEQLDQDAGSQHDRRSQRAPGIER